MTESIRAAFSGEKVLILGGTGFIGGRLVERLVLECHAQVRVMVRNFARAARIARFPVEMIPGDVMNQKDVMRAASGCAVVFYCVYIFQESEKKEREANLTATENVIQASMRAGVKRVVYLSSQMAYGLPPDGDLDETAPRRACKVFGSYSAVKMETEKMVFDYVHKKKLAVSVLQPTAVYGPYARGWTSSIFQMLKTHRLLLVNGGNGLCNAVYIDDAVHAILLAATKTTAVGEAFLVSANRPITWKDFFSRFEQILGESSTVDVTVRQAETFYRRQNRRQGVLTVAWRLVRENPEIRRQIRDSREAACALHLIKQKLPDRVQQALLGRVKSHGTERVDTALKHSRKPILPIDPPLIRFYASRVRIRIDKAKKQLGYQPVYDFEAGMRLTEQWARWANLAGR